jgi:hypothetical protein
VYGLETVNNGGDPVGAAITLLGNATAETFLYVTSEAISFEDFFDFAPTLTSAVVNINGDDVVVLYEDDIIVDVFGETIVDGTGEPWES